MNRDREESNNITNHEFNSLNQGTCGKGSYGVVQTGILKTGRLVAIKSIGTNKGSRFSQNFSREIEALKKCYGAANIVQIMGWKEDCSSFAMELANLSLDAMMEQFPYKIGLPQNIMMDLLQDLTSAILTLNAQNIVHRDLKMQNILVFNSPFRKRRCPHVFKVCDLGASAHASDPLVTLVGTTPYLLPKLATYYARGGRAETQGSECYTPVESDCWTLGCTLYIAATGSFPFTICNGTQFLAAALENRKPGEISVTGEGSTFVAAKEIPDPANKFPRWFVHVLSSLIRTLFDNPSYESLERLVKAITTANEFKLLSLKTLEEISYAQIMDVPEFRESYPNLRSALSIPKDTEGFYILSEKSVLKSSEVCLSTLDHKIPYIVWPKDGNLRSAKNFLDIYSQRKFKPSISQARWSYYVSIFGEKLLSFRNLLQSSSQKITAHIELLISHRLQLGSLVISIGRLLIQLCESSFFAQHKQEKLQYIGATNIPSDLERLHSISECIIHLQGVLKTYANDNKLNFECDIDFTGEKEEIIQYIDYLKTTNGGRNEYVHALTRRVATSVHNLEHEVLEHSEYTHKHLSSVVQAWELLHQSKDLFYSNTKSFEGVLRDVTGKLNNVYGCPDVGDKTAVYEHYQEELKKIVEQLKELTSLTNSVHH